MNELPPHPESKGEDPEKWGDQRPPLRIGHGADFGQHIDPSEWITTAADEPNSVASHSDSPEHEEALARYPGILLALDGVSMPEASAWVYAAVETVELERCAKNLLARYAHVGATGVVIAEVHDFGDFKPEPDESLETVAMVGRGIREHGDAYAFWAQLHDGDPAMCAHFSNAYRGAWASAVEWAGAAVEQIRAQESQNRTRGSPDEDLDLEAMVQWLWLDGRIQIAHRDGGGVWIFEAQA